MHKKLVNYSLSQSMKESLLYSKTNSWITLIWVWVEIHHIPVLNLHSTFSLLVPFNHLAKRVGTMIMPVLNCFTQ